MTHPPITLSDLLRDLLIIIAWATMKWLNELFLCLLSTFFPNLLVLTPFSVLCVTIY